MPKTAELLIPPPIVMAIAAAVMWGLSRITNFSLIPDAWRIPVTMILVLIGAVIALAGVLAFIRARTTVNPHRPDKSSVLVQNGIYRITRNPMYLGMLLALMAWSFWLNAAVTLVTPALFIAWIHRFQILPEERVLEQNFGESFRAYCRRVRRWL